jgi:DNA-binding transcriptional LysR family regulator
VPGLRPICCQIPFITPSIAPLTSSPTTPLEPLDSKRLKVFVLIVRTGSIAAAANLTSSAVSHSLKGLEEELVVIVSPRHPWANLRRLGPEQLNGEKLTLYRRDSLSAKLVQEHLKKLGVSLNKSVSLSSMAQTLIGLCKDVTSSPPFTK